MLTLKLACSWKMDINNKQWMSLLRTTTTNNFKDILVKKRLYLLSKKCPFNLCPFKYEFCQCEATVVIVYIARAM